MPQGARTGIEAISRTPVDPQTPIPGMIHRAMNLLVEEIRLLELRIGTLERELAELAKQSPACTTLLPIPGVGLLTATVMVAATGGQVSRFMDPPATSPAGSA